MQVSYTTGCMSASDVHCVAGRGSMGPGCENRLRCLGLTKFPAFWLQNRPIRYPAVKISSTPMQRTRLHLDEKRGLLVFQRNDGERRPDVDLRCPVSPEAEFVP
jgi:hypothetical protein